ncbi:hypothetical protein EV1_039192 [Malus domestica]
MGNYLSLSPSATSVFKETQALPIETTFKLPSPLPSWPPGDGFTSGMIDLGGLLVCQISSFNKALAAKPTKDNDDDPSSPLLRQPVDFTLVWSSEFLNIKKDGNGYVWLPTASNGYKTISLVVTSSPKKPSLDKIRCVRSSLTDECEADSWIWGPVYLPSSVGWFFTNGPLLYKKDDDLKPIAIEATGSNLPLVGSNDGSYWLDLTVDKSANERVKKRNLPSSQVYAHIKPMMGSTFTDITIWVFYPFNGPARANEFLNISLGKIGEHVGNWEHVTLRVSNFIGELWKVYFSQHSGGIWVEASELEF